MADDTLKRLLDAENRGQRQVDEALKERDRIVAEARAEAQQAEQRFEEHIPEIYASCRERAEARALQAVTELRQRYERYGTEIEAGARGAMDEAVDAALARLLGADT